MQNTKKNTIFVHVKTTYCFHKPTFLKFKKSVNEHCFKDNKYFCDSEHVSRIFCSCGLDFSKNKANFAQFEGNH